MIHHVRIDERLRNAILPQPQTLKCDRIRENQPYVGEINLEIRAFIATSGRY